MNPVYSDLGTALLQSGAVNGASGGILDARAAGDFAILEVQCSGNSAVWDFLFSPQGTDFGTALTVTATVGTTAFYQVSAYYPFVKFAARLVASAAGGSARVNAYYRPGYSK